jgi:hypothetical protein
MGAIAGIRGGRLKIEWESGRTTETALRSIAKGDIILEC